MIRLRREGARVLVDCAFPDSLAAIEFYDRTLADARVNGMKIGAYSVPPATDAQPEP